jgi:hypothetical protein
MLWSFLNLLQDAVGVTEERLNGNRCRKDGTDILLHVAAEQHRNIVGEVGKKVMTWRQLAMKRTCEDNATMKQPAARNIGRLTRRKIVGFGTLAFCGGWLTACQWIRASRQAL